MRRRNLRDKTRNHDFINEHGNRCLAWDTLRAYIFGEIYNPSEIAERTGLPIYYVYDTIETVKRKLKEKLTNE